MNQEPLFRVDEEAIPRALEAGSRADSERVRDVLQKSAEAQGLTPAEVAVLSGISDPALLGELFATAREVKERIYGRRLVIFAPLYISNLCSNECLYCAFRARNKDRKSVV